MRHRPMRNEALDKQAITPQDAPYVVIENHQLTAGPDVDHVLSETKIVTPSEHPIKEDFVIFLAEQTVPRNTVRGILSKELLTYGRYSDALHCLRKDPFAAVL